MRPALQVTHEPSLKVHGFSVAWGHFSTLFEDVETDLNNIRKSDTMNEIITRNETAIVSPLSQGEKIDGFSIALLKREIAKINPNMSKGELRKAANAKIRAMQGVAIANQNEALRQGYTIVKQVMTSSGRIHQTLAAPTKAERKNVDVSKMTTEALLAEITRRQAQQVASAALALA
jgi:hypothetical protein